MFKLIIYIFAIFCFVGCYNGYTENYIQIKDNKTKPLKNEIKFVNTFDTSDIIKNGYSIIGYSTFRNNWLNWKYDCYISGEILNSEVTIYLEPTFVRSYYTTYRSSKIVTYQENTDVNVYGDVRLWGNSTTTGSIKIPTEETIKVNVYEYRSIYLKKEKYIFGVVPDKFENSQITIKYVIKNSPAEFQGIVENDTLLEFNGKKIISLGQFNDFETTHHDSVVVIKIKNQTIKNVYIKFG